MNIDYSTTWCLLNGLIVKLQDAHLSLTDIGILRGYGFTEYIRTYGGKAFLLDEHVARLFHSSDVVHLPVPYSQENIKQWVIQLLKKNNFPESHIKIIVTGGPSEDGVGVFNPTFFILVTPLTSYKETYYSEGIAMMTHEHLREFPEAKGTNYMTTIALRGEKKEKHIFELLYTYQGTVLESSMSNVFFFLGNTLVTPKDKILKGVTRDVVISLAQEKWKVEEREVSIEEMNKAEEVFITGSYKEIMPVVRIDANIVGNGKPGVRTKELMLLYRRFVGEWKDRNI